MPDYPDVFTCAFQYTLTPPATTLGVTPYFYSDYSIIRIPELNKSLVSGGTYTYNIRIDDNRDGLFASYDFQIDICEFDMTISGASELTYDYKNAVTFSFTITPVSNSPASCATAYTTGLEYYSSDFTDTDHTVLDADSYTWTLGI